MPYPTSQQKPSSQAPRAAANGARPSATGSGASVPPSKVPGNVKMAEREAAAQSPQTPSGDDEDNNVARPSRPALRSVPPPSSSDAIDVDADWTSVAPLSSGAQHTYEADHGCYFQSSERA